jgi:hypothetical protein
MIAAIHLVSSMLDTISNIPLTLGLGVEVLLNCGSVFFAP